MDRFEREWRVICTINDIRYEREGVEDRQICDTELLLTSK